MRSAGFLALLLLAPWASSQEEGGAKKEKDKGGLTGAVSEKAFEALHELSAEKRPAPKGVWVELAGTKTKAYLSLPPGKKPPFPALVVIHEWWGLNRHIEYWSDRLAALGYAALAIDLYGGKTAETPEQAMALMKAVDGDQARKVLAAGFEFLAKDDRVKAKRRGCIGWCFGGTWSLQLALMEKDLDACVLYYGHPVLQPEKLKAIGAPLLGIFGNKDPSIPPDTVNAFDKALEEAGVKHEILRYDAPHAFANPSNARYDFKAAEDAFAHVRKFLAKHLAGR